jgi:hypothetical protein
MLELFLLPQLQQGSELADILFPQGGVPPHYHCRVACFLDDIFPNKWVGRGGPIGWPPRSPDLTSLHFHFLGYVKDQVYVPPLAQFSRKMRDRIRDAVKSVDEDILRKAWDETAFRWDVCLIIMCQFIQKLLEWIWG